MIVDCLRVRRHIQVRFDGGESSLTDRDALHIRSCPRCCGLFRRYSRFASKLRARAASSLSGLGAPDWQGVFAAASDSAPHGSLSNGAVAETGRESELTRTRTRLSEGRGRAQRIKEHAIRAFGVLPAWTRSTSARAALLALALCLGGFLGYRQYRIATARSFVRENTSEFVDTILSSSIFQASPETAGPPGAVAVDSAWFDATDSNVELPLPPPGSATGDTATPSPR